MTAQEEYDYLLPLYFALKRLHIESERQMLGNDETMNRLFLKMHRYTAVWLLLTKGKLTVYKKEGAK
jgi:hypothetical protein